MDTRIVRFLIVASLLGCGDGTHVTPDATPVPDGPSAPGLDDFTAEEKAALAQLTPPHVAQARRANHDGFHALVVRVILEELLPDPGFSQPYAVRDQHAVRAVDEGDAIR